MNPSGDDWTEDDREVTASAEAAERTRTAPAALEFVAEVSGDQHTNLVRWQDEQHSLWNRALADRLEQGWPQTHAEHIENNRFQLFWLTDERRVNADLKAVPSVFQQAILYRLSRALERYYFERGDKPKPWRTTTVKWALISCGVVTGVRIAGENKVQLPKLGVLTLKGAAPLPADATLKRFSIARNGDQWDVLIYTSA
jgi:hypothetical protein